MDADARLVGLEIGRRQETHVVGRDHRHTPPDRQVHAGFDQLGLLRPAGADQLQVVTITEGREPAVEQSVGLLWPPLEQCLSNVAARSAGQRDQASSSPPGSIRAPT